MNSLEIAARIILAVLAIGLAIGSVFWMVRPK